MYIINTDASIEPFNPGGLIAWAFIVRSIGVQKGEIYRDCSIFRHEFSESNTTGNKGEYLAVVAAILWLLKMPENQRRSVIIQSDSQLVVNQCSGVWEVKAPELQVYHKLIRQGMRKFGKSITFKWIPREKNADADELSRSVYQTEDIQQELQTLRDQKFKDQFEDDDISF